MNRDRRERKVWKLLPWPKFGLFSCAGETVCSAAPPAITMDARERDKEFIILLQAGGDGSSLELWNFPRPNVKSISWKRFTGHIEGYLETARSSGIRLYLQSSGLQHFNLFPLKRLKGTIKRQFPGFKGDGWIWSLSMALYVITGKSKVGNTDAKTERGWREVIQSQQTETYLCSDLVAACWHC